MKTITLNLENLQKSLEQLSKGCDEDKPMYDMKEKEKKKKEEEEAKAKEMEKADMKKSLPSESEVVDVTEAFSSLRKSILDSVEENKNVLLAMNEVNNNKHLSLTKSLSEMGPLLKSLVGELSELRKEVDLLKGQPASSPQAHLHAPTETHNYPMASDFQKSLISPYTQTTSNVSAKDFLDALITGVEQKQLGAEEVTGFELALQNHGPEQAFKSVSQRAQSFVKSVLHSNVNK